MHVEVRAMKADVEELRKARPYIRSVLAFLIYMRYEGAPSDMSYRIADAFIDQLAADLEAQK